MSDFLYFSSSSTQYHTIERVLKIIFSKKLNNKNLAKLISKIKDVYEKDFRSMLLSNLIQEKDVVLSFYSLSF